MRIGVVDAETGNIGSLRGALHSLGVDSFVVRSPRDFDEVESVILPGVGAYAHFSGSIDRLGLREALHAHASAGRPVLGICLGMQFLFEGSEEGDPAPGLALMSGRVKRLVGGDELPLPHVGWNEILVERQHALLRGIRPGVDFYFVHSYRAACASEHVVATAEYGERFPAVVAAGNVVGIQFHAEKSQKNGLRLLENFCDWDGRC